METMEVLDVPRAIRAREFAKLRDVLGHWEPFGGGRRDPRSARRRTRRSCFASCRVSAPLAVFEFLDTAAQQRLLKALGQEEAAAILNDMAADDRTALLEELPADRANQFLALLSPEGDGRPVALAIPGESIGRVMTPDYVAVEKNWTIKQVLDHVRSQGKDRETLNVLYVVDDNHRLIDDIRIREVLLTPPHVHVSADVMDGRYVALRASDDKETAVGVFRK